MSVTFGVSSDNIEFIFLVLFKTMYRQHTFFFYLSSNISDHLLCRPGDDVTEAWPARGRVERRERQRSEEDSRPSVHQGTAGRRRRHDGQQWRGRRRQDGGEQRTRLPALLAAQDGKRGTEGLFFFGLD